MARSDSSFSAIFIIIVISSVLLCLLIPPVAATPGKHKSKNVNLSGSETRTRNLENRQQQSLATVSITNGSTSISSEDLTVEKTDVNSEDDDEEGREEDQVPEVPSSLRAKPTATTIHVTWTPPLNSKILVRGYTIGWGVGFPDVYSKVLESKARSFTITDLDPKSEYVISLRGYNNMGDGPPAYETVRTLASADTDGATPHIFPPLGLKANVLSSSAVMLQWSDTGLSTRQTISDNRYYVVRYTSNVRSPSPKFKHVNATKTSVMIDDLKPSTQYEFSVKVVKGRQESTWSMGVVNTTQEAAPSSEPRDLTVVPDWDNNPSTVRLQWQPPKQPNGQITGHVIFYTTDDSLSDRDWSAQTLVGDKMNAVLNNLLPDTTYFFKVQAINKKGPGPFSAPVRFRTLPLDHSANVVQDPKALSPQSLIVVITGIVALTLALILLVVVLLCKTRGGQDHKRKGYSAANGSSPRNNKNKRVSRELNPPDLWIHHTEQLELKSLEKNPEDLAPTPVLRTFQDMSNSQEDRKTVTSYATDSLYDDVSRRTATSPAIDGSTHTITSYPSGTSTIRRTARAKPIMIPVDSAPVSTVGAVFEPSTGLSRPVYPRTQSYSVQHSIQKPQLCYEMNDGTQTLGSSPYSDQNSDHSSSHQIMHQTQQQQQQQYHQHQIMPPYPPTLSSNNVSYSSGGSSLQSPILSDPPPPPSLNHCLTTSSPSINNLTLRPLTLQSLRSFNGCMDPTAQNTPKHMAVKPQMNTSPLKKMNGSGFNTISGKPTPHIVNPSFKDDVHSYQQTHEELCNDLDGIMKELNAITSPDYDHHHHHANH